MKRKMAAMAAVLAGYVCAGTANAQEVERARITTETVSTPSSTLTTQTVDVDYEIDKRRDQGWNSQWGLLFSFNNVFNFNGGPILDTFRGLGASGFYTLSPDMMLRGGFTLSRSHNPVGITKTTVTTGPGEEITYTRDGINAASTMTTTFELNVHADMLWRLTRNKVAPYVGVGAMIGYQYDRLSFDDDVVNPNAVIKYRGRDTDLSLGLRGIVGAEWRVHSNFALFAEYNLTAEMLHYVIDNDRTTYQNTADNPTAVSSVYNQRNTASWFNLSTELTQGAQLGVMVFF